MTQIPTITNGQARILQGEQHGDSRPRSYLDAFPAVVQGRRFVFVRPVTKVLFLRLAWKEMGASGSLSGVMAGMRWCGSLPRGIHSFREGTAADVTNLVVPYASRHSGVSRCNGP